MDTTVTMDQQNELVNVSQKIAKKEEEDCVVVEAKENVTEISLQSTVAAIGPITPDSNKETGDFLFGVTSPLTFVSSPENDNLGASINFSPQTPVEGVFDPGFDGFNTPDSATRLTGIAETCPGAPVKTAGTTKKLRIIDQGLCRKLEF
jgi:hypothetical protein